MPALQKLPIEVWNIIKDYVAASNNSIRIHKLNEARNLARFSQICKTFKNISKEQLDQMHEEYIRHENWWKEREIDQKFKSRIMRRY